MRLKYGHEQQHYLNTNEKAVEIAWKLAKLEAKQTCVLDCDASSARQVIAEWIAWSNAEGKHEHKPWFGDYAATFNLEIEPVDGEMPGVPKP